MWGGTVPKLRDAYIACMYGDILNFESYVYVFFIARTNLSCAYVYCPFEFKLREHLLAEF